MKAFHVFKDLCDSWALKNMLLFFLQWIITARSRFDSSGKNTFFWCPQTWFASLKAIDKRSKMFIFAYLLQIGYLWKYFSGTFRWSVSWSRSWRRADFSEAFCCQPCGCSQTYYLHLQFCNLTGKGPCLPVWSWNSCLRVLWGCL